MAGVIRDAAGDLYGTADGYGQLASGDQGEGVVFKLDAAGNYTVLYTFTGGADGGGPEAGVILDSAGNLYGTTTFGGAPGCKLGPCGVVYELAPSGQETALHSFTGGANGANCQAGVLLGAAGSLYGIRPFGGTAGSGVLYMVAPQ